MSTKIYDAYKFKINYTQYELSRKLDDLRAEIKAICDRDILSRVIRKTLQYYHLKQFCGDSLISKMIITSDSCKTDRDTLYTNRIREATLKEDWYSVYIENYMHIIDKISESAKSSFRCGYYRCTLQIIPLKTKILALYFGNPMLRDYLESVPDFLEDYHYQDQSERPDSISKEMWHLRERDWDVAIGPDYIPAQHGFVANLFDTENIMPLFTPSRIQDVIMPSIEQQLYAVRKSLITISSADEYEKQVEESNKQIQKRCNLITDFDEFCELVDPKKK